MNLKNNTEQLSTYADEIGLSAMHFSKIGLIRLNLNKVTVDETYYKGLSEEN